MFLTLALVNDAGLWCRFGQCYTANFCTLAQQLPQITQRELLQQVEREKKKNPLISLVLVLTSSPIPALTWTFCLSSDTYRSGVYCSESLHPRCWCNWYRAVAMSLHVQ